MIQPVTAKINRKGHLEIGRCDTVALAKKFGTPLYVMDEATLRANCRAYSSAFKGTGLSYRLTYASKALSVVSVLKVIKSEGLGVDVSSAGELFTAVSAGINPKTIYFHGNNKTHDELLYAIKSGVGRIVVDNFYELELLEGLSRKLRKNVNILIRVNPGIEAHTHEYIKTAKVDSKFGLSKDVVLDMIGLIQEMEYVKFTGIHGHIGSQIFDVEPFKSETQFLIEFCARILERFGITVDEINLGGGIGISYVEGDNPSPVKILIKTIAGTVLTESKKAGIEPPKVVLEPGRSIVGSAGVTLYTVGAVKEIPDIRKYIMIDGGMSDNPRPILYGAKYDATIANKAGNPKNDIVTVAGRFCESGDILIKNIALQNPESGDVLAVFCTGAYNYSMAGNYNRVPRPAMVMVNRGRAKLIVKRETYWDLVRNDIK